MKSSLAIATGFLALLVLPSTLPADTTGLVVPAGLNPGDQYRIAFVTSTTTDATSTNIAYYNTFVNDVANASGSLLAPLDATWTAIAETPGVSALANIDSTSTLPIYRLDGTLVGTSSDELINCWRTSSCLSAGILFQEDGVSLAQASPNVWTGYVGYAGACFEGCLGVVYSDPYGFALGAIAGDGTSQAGSWLSAAWELDIDTQFHMLGISGPITVPGVSAVPEPGAVCLTLAMLAAIIPLSTRRKRSA